MPQLPPLVEILADARISALVAVPTPALLFDTDGHLLFANPAGLRLVNALTLPEAAAREPNQLGPLADAAQRLSPGLPSSGTPRLERLKLSGTNFLHPNTFACSRISFVNGKEAVLIAGLDVGKEKAPTLLLATGSLLDDTRDAFALFDIDGNLIEANTIAAFAIGSAQTLQELDPGAAAALDSARSQGAAETDFGVLRIVLRRIGTKAQSGILALFADANQQSVEKSKSAEVSATEPREIASPDLESSPVPAVAPSENKRIETRRTPSRFVWQTDPEGRFISTSSELADVVGAKSADVLGLDWREAASCFGIENAEEVAAAIARRDTWSGVTVLWPVTGKDRAHPVDLAALPVFDRERRFQGYRGFGVFREAITHHIKAEPAVSKTNSEPERSAPPPLVEKPENVVRLRAAASTPEPAKPALSPSERNTFREIARTLGERIEGVNSTKTSPADAGPVAKFKAASASDLAGSAILTGERALLDRIPLGIVVHRADRVLYANRAVLEWIGLANIEALDEEGGLNRLFSGAHALDEDEASRTLAVAGRRGEPIPVQAKLFSAPWDGETALVYILHQTGGVSDKRSEASELKLREAESVSGELRGILDTATDGVILFDRDGRVLSLNRSAEALFGYDSAEIEGQNFTRLFAPESHRSAIDYLEGLAANGVASLLNDGREMIGQVREGGLIPLFMTLGKIGDNPKKFCAVFRDITQWKRAEEELLEAKRKAEQSSSAKSDFLAKISHEIRTPLNAIIGFADVMREERFGPIGNERYREYLKDIQTSGAHLISLINDLLDLSKIEAGKVDLSFSGVDLNDIARQCMAIMQTQANRERIIIRTSLFPELPQVVADVRSIRQIVLNLLSNSIKFTPPGGQVIVSTQLSETGEVLLRVRDTGVGMSEADVATALEPFRQLSTTGRGTAGGSGLGLPLTKALAEANRAGFAVKSNVNAGTLVEISFPSNRVLAG